MNCILIIVFSCFLLNTDAGIASDILKATGIKGGLVVHIGCGDGKLLAALYANEGFLVQGLDKDIRKTREYIQNSGIYGKVTVKQWQGSRLPYIDNLVNLIISDRKVKVPIDEIMRVLVPEGIAYLKEGNKWIKKRKPRPKEIDEWTHYLHDAGNNAVAHDTVVGPPRHLQWVGSPKWARHHDRMGSMTALVSGGGRIFYIFDEGPTSAIMLPSQFSLITRDAFNGVILWKKPIKTWFNRFWPYKSGPAQFARRLVAVNNKVYATLDLNAPLTELDAATGKIISTIKNSTRTEEVIVSGDRIFILVNRNPLQKDKYQPIYRDVHDSRDMLGQEEEWGWDKKKRVIMAVDMSTGKMIWEKEFRVVPISLAADENVLFFHDGEKIICLNRNNGKVKWQSEPVDIKMNIPVNFGPTLVSYKDVVLFSGGTRSMFSLSKKDGKILWKARHPKSGHHSPEDLFVIDGLVWAGDIAAGKGSGKFTGRNPLTGEVKKEFEPDIETYWFHHRCHRSKATVKYILPSRTGIEFVDIASETWDINHWVRGACIYGIMPANGLIYAPMHSCACYPDAKLNGFNALAPARKKDKKSPKTEQRLIQGPAYKNKIHETSVSDEDWPYFRHDNKRSGSTKTVLPSALKQVWLNKIGGRLSSPVIALGKVFISSIDNHTVYALDAGIGKTLWQFTAEGRIDSSPTIFKGRVFFGSADGCVYALQASDGQLIWQFRAAPGDQFLTSFEQLESVWPVSGSVLIEKDVLYTIAGRSMFLDNGMRMYRLDPLTGGVLSETKLNEIDAETGQPLQAKINNLNMPAALPDILSCDDSYIYMRSQQFDFTGKPINIGPKDAKNQNGPGNHLFSPTGFLDGSWWHRSYWVYGKAMAGGASGWYIAGKNAPSGRIMVFDKDNVYSYGRKPKYLCWSTPLEYHLFSSVKEPKSIPLPEKENIFDTFKKSPAKKKKKKSNTKGRVDKRIEYRWTQDIPLHVKAMTLAGKILYISGIPDKLDEEEAFKDPFGRDISKKYKDQLASMKGDFGGILRAVAADTGKIIKEYKLDHVPTFDGMIAARNRLFYTTEDGRVVCMGKK